MAINVREAIATVVVLGGDVRKTWSCRVALQITIIQAVHAFVAKNPDVRYTNTAKFGHLRKKLPAEDHFGHIANSCLSQGPHVIEIPYHGRVHRNAADAVPIIRGDVVAW